MVRRNILTLQRPPCCILSVEFKRFISVVCDILAVAYLYGRLGTASTITMVVGVIVGVPRFF